jgi:hypothetical protein
MRLIQVDAGPDGKRKARIYGGYKPDPITLCCFAAVVAGIIAVLIIGLMPLP